MKKILIYSFALISILIGILFILYDAKHPLAIFIVSGLIALKIQVTLLSKVIVSKFLYLLKASKSKIVLFIKSLTIYKTLVLSVKRFIIDNVFSKWLDKHIIKHIKEPIIDFIKYYKNLNWKRKATQLISVIIPLSVIISITYYLGWLEHLFFYVEIKSIVIGFFKLLWAFFGKIFVMIVYFLKNSWLGSILEIFALSWLLTKVEKIPYIGKYIHSFFVFIEKYITIMFRKIGIWYNIYIGKYFTKYLTKYVKKWAQILRDKLEDTKYKNEIFAINYFKEKFLNGNIDKYFKVKGKYKDKNEFYKVVNKETNDHVDIICYIEVDDNKDIFPVKDVLILESSASCNKNGNNNGKINKNSFWVLNLSDKNLWLISKNNYFSPKYLKSNKLKLVNSLNQDHNDIYIIDNDENEYYCKEVK